MSLEFLVPELLSLILHSIDSPRSLHNLISASPASPTPATTTGVSSFLDKYFDESSAFDFPTSTVELIKLYKVYNRLSFLIDGYLNGIKKLDFDDSVITPSPSELTRLQRAFLRYGLYSRVFPADDTLPWEDPSPNHRFSALKQFDLFVSRLKPWECEEIVCVEQYFSTLIGNFVDEMEEQLAGTVKSAVVFKPPIWEDDAQADLKDVGAEENLWRFDALDLTSLAMFSFDNRYRIHDNITYMASLGLDFMYDLIRSDKDEHLRLIRSNSPNFRHFLEEALTCSPGLTMQECDEESAWDDDPSYNNLAWLQLGLGSQSWKYLRIDRWSCRMSPLRELGYVFWDSARLKSTAVQERLAIASSVSSDKATARGIRRDKETVEERFNGAMIPRRELTRLESQFGYIRRPMEEELE
ncbi:hypothetical protein NW766_005859 [Fusarium irregulare]|uniref:Uncharacterized protein n=1 Tax=Fusarium irregulare TaxID=2494466 RepID=A0A9W8PS03_9HYPO|nr:hypothetical protein NW766_005859 [Fusarium irregulare]